mgnify:CR=1 FL=1
MNNNDQLNLLRIFFLISGILNIGYALGWSGYTLIGGLVSCGLCCILGAIPVFNIIACIMDFISYTRLSRMDRSGTYSTLQFTSVFDIITILTGNIFSMIAGIIGLIFINNEEIKEFMKNKGIY